MECRRWGDVESKGFEVIGHQQRDVTASATHMSVRRAES